MSGVTRWTGAIFPSSLRRSRNYVLLWSGQTVSAIGSQFSGFVIPLLVLALTGSPAQAGLVGALESVPYIVVSLPAGVLVDRWDRKVVMIVCDCGRALNMVSAVVALALGRLSMPQLYVVAVVEGTLFVFFNLAETSSLARVVPASDLSAAMAQQELTWGISALSGPAIAGALYSAIGAAVPLLVDGISYGVSALSLTAIRIDPQLEGEAGSQSISSGLREALQFLRRQPLLRALALLTAAGDFLFSGIGLIPMVIARQQMHAPAAVIGLIFTLAALGGIAGSLLSGQVRKRFSTGQTIIGSEWATALLFPLFAIAPNPITLGLVRTLISAAVSISNPVRLSYQLAVTPDHLQGRVNSLTTLLAYGSLPLGLALTGIALQVVGPAATILGITALLVVEAVAASWSRQIRQAGETAISGSP